MYKQIYVGKIDLLVYFLSSVSTNYLQVASKPQNFSIAPSKCCSLKGRRLCIQLVRPIRLKCMYTKRDRPM